MGKGPGMPTIVVDKDGNKTLKRQGSADEGYGTTPLQRAQFIIDTIRIHLVRQASTHHHDDLSSIQAILGAPARWCPVCGTRLPAP